MIGVFTKKSFNLVFNLSTITLLVTAGIIVNSSNVSEKIFLDSFMKDSFSNFLKF